MLNLSYSLGPITNLPKTATNDIHNGPGKMGSTSPSKSLQGDGLEPRAEWDNKVPTPHYPDNNPKTAVGAKKLPLEVVPPSAVHALAEAFADGARKYGPYNWREKTISSSIYYAAALRHITAWWDGEDIARDSGVPHLHHAIACLAMLIDGGSVGKLNDNRPPKGAASVMQEAWLNKAANEEKFKHEQSA